jgi:hypothetical protein
VKWTKVSQGSIAVSQRPSCERLLSDAQRPFENNALRATRAPIRPKLNQVGQEIFPALLVPSLSTFVSQEPVLFQFSTVLQKATFL